MKTVKERFEEKYTVCNNTGCWNWHGALMGSGYGNIMNENGKLEGAHRLSYRLNKGDIGASFVLHECDNPLCVNPDHLFLGSQKDNLADMTNKGRRRSNSPKGSKHVHSKLVEKEVLEIRSKYVPYQYGLQKLADEYGVSKRNIYLIIVRKAWRHI